MKFSQFDLDANILKGIDKAGFVDCLPVQEQTFEQSLTNHKDVCVQSQTGTGKTAAFLIPTFQMLLSHEQFKNEKVLVIAPTRELADQIEKEAKLLGKYLPFSIGAFYGGIGFDKQEKLLKEGVNIIIGTPGRLLDFGRQKKLNFKDIGILIIDEADRLFDMGFLPDIRAMLKQMRPLEERRTMLFSATLDYRVKEVAWEYMNEPADIEIEPEQVTVEKISQELYHIERSKKMRLLLGLFKKEAPKNALIFTNTKHKAYEVSERLKHNGYDCHYIMGDLPQKKRLRVIEDLKAGNIKYLVATDVAARGLHIDDLDLVINYDVPAETENYVHRIGRTARAGKSGKAITFACEQYVFNLESIETYINMKLPVTWPDDDIFTEDKSRGMTFKLERGERGVPREKVSRAHTGRRKSAEPHRTTAHKNAVHEQRNAEKPRHHKQDHKHKPAAKNPNKKVVKKSPSRPTRSLTQEERVAYYQQKYGENFGAPSPATSKSMPAKSKKSPAKAKPATQVNPPAAQPKKKSFLQRVVDFMAG
ncbi:MAG: DEAD/DEAH box helicase [Deltaproteobacteria bacterium]|nr:DEAD/DEAH box helicase [Deltaproteobacteria bacterium]